jgi:hypothetical protein
LQGLFYLTVLFYVFDRISNEFQLYLFLPQWENIQSVMCLRLTNLSPGTSADSVYPGKSAYEAQFLGKNHSLILPKSGALVLNLKRDSRISNEVQ